MVVLGVFSVTAYTVTRQTRELGIRMALGAQRSMVMHLVIFKALQQIAIGIVIGLIAAFAAARLLANQFWGMSGSDPSTFVGVAIVLLIVGLFASGLPAHRATLIDPLIAIRNE